MCSLYNYDQHQNLPSFPTRRSSDLSSQLQIFESGAYRGAFGNYSTGDHLRVAVESGVVKYSRNGTVFYTSGTAPNYPVLEEPIYHANNSTIDKVIISGNFDSNVQNV